MGEDTVTLEDVVFRWRPTLSPCLEIAEFRVSAGERVFLHGPSGSGKSSMLSLIGGVSLPERGQVRVLGTDLARLPGAARDRFRAEHLGFVFQLFNLIPYLSALDNIMLPCRFSARRRAAVEAAGGSVRDEARRLASGSTSLRICSIVPRRSCPSASSSASRRRAPSSGDPIW